MNDMNSLPHTKWECKYHIVFAPKYRRKVFYGEKRVEIGKILRMLCDKLFMSFIRMTSFCCPLLQLPDRFLIIQQKEFLLLHDRQKAFFEPLA